MRRITTASLALTIAATSVFAGAAAVMAQDNSDLKIGLVTDVGTLDDRNFNQYSWEGTLDGAERIGAPKPDAAISLTSADIAPNIQAFVDEDYDIIVTVGFAAFEQTAEAAKANPDIEFIGVDQYFVCLDEEGNLDKDDPTTPDVNEAECKGDAATLLPNRVGIGFREQQVGYLAGIVAGHATESGEVAVVAGTYSVPSNPNYVIGFNHGVKAVDPNIEVTTYYVSPQPDAKAFNDPAQGKSDANQLLTFFPGIDVLYQVAGKTGNGVLEAACEAGIHGIGVDVDQFLSTPEFQDCIIVSAEKKLFNTVSDMLVNVADGVEPSGGVKLDITTGDHVGLSPFHDYQDSVTPELQADLDAAIAGLKDGSVQACVLNKFDECEVSKDGRTWPSVE
jgi:basic membrane protein A